MNFSSYCFNVASLDPKVSHKQQSSPHISSQPAKWGKCLRGLWLFAPLLCLKTWILGVCWSSHSVNESLLADSTNVWYECAIWASLSSAYSGYILKVFQQKYNFSYSFKYALVYYGKEHNLWNTVLLTILTRWTPRAN